MTILELWLQNNAVCCTLSSSTMSVNPSNPNPPTSCSMHAPQTEDWLTTYGNSFFQFAYSESLSATLGVGTLTITDCTFQNFFYDFSSFIGLVNGHGHVVASGSTFARFSNCGSIIRDTREYPALDYTDTGLSASAKLYYRASMVTSNILQSKFFIEPSSPWKTSSWSSIKIEGCTFSNFNSMKTESKFIPYILTGSNMVQQGKILSLQNFYGNVVLKGNTFTGVVFKWQKWEILNQNTPINDVSDSIFSPSSTSSNQYQAKSLININVRNSAVEIYENTFTSCNSIFGLIYLRRSATSTGSILIHNNQFTKNSALTGANVLRIYLQTTQSTYSVFTGTEMIWANLKISSNTFTQNIGCHDTSGAMQVVCYEQTSYSMAISTYNHYSTPMTLSVSTQTTIEAQAGILAFNIESIK